MRCCGILLIRIYSVRIYYIIIWLSPIIRSRVFRVQIIHNRVFRVWIINKRIIRSRLGRMELIFFCSIFFTYLILYFLHIS